MAKKFSTLRARMSPQAQARAAAHTQAMLVELGHQEPKNAAMLPDCEIKLSRLEAAR